MIFGDFCGYFFCDFGAIFFVVVLFGSIFGAGVVIRSGYFRIFCAILERLDL